jgi:hypothetical protein
VHQKFRFGLLNYTAVVRCRISSNQLATVHHAKEPCALATAVPQKMSRLLFGNRVDCSMAGRDSNGFEGVESK